MTKVDQWEEVAGKPMFSCSEKQVLIAAQHCTRCLAQGWERARKDHLSGGSERLRLGCEVQVAVLWALDPAPTTDSLSVPQLEHILSLNLSFPICTMKTLDTSSRSWSPLLIWREQGYFSLTVGDFQPTLLWWTMNRVRCGFIPC